MLVRASFGGRDIFGRWVYGVGPMRRNMVVAAVIGVVLVVGLAVVVGVAVYGKGQPMIVEASGFEPADWFSNGVEHLTGNTNDASERSQDWMESEDGRAFFRDVAVPVGFLVFGAAGLVAIGWLVVDHRRRQRRV